MPHRELSPPPARPSDPDPLAAALADEAADRSRLRRALGAAAVLHALLLLVTVPRSLSEPPPPPSQKATVVLTDVRYEPPEPPVHRPKPLTPREAAVTIPVPDPDPAEPELAPAEEPEIDLAVPDLLAILELPEPPPGPAPASDEPIQVRGEVVAPERLVAPTPHYTEPARRARIEGEVVLRAVIDRDGRVRDLGVVKGLPLGLTEQALGTVRTWSFRPATLRGEPVVVEYLLRIRFRLQ